MRHSAHAPCILECLVGRRRRFAYVVHFMNTGVTMAGRPDLRGQHDQSTSRSSRRPGRALICLQRVVGTTYRPRTDCTADPCALLAQGSSLFRSPPIIRDRAGAIRPDFSVCVESLVALAGKLHSCVANNLSRSLLGSGKGAGAPPLRLPGKTVCVCLGRCNFFVSFRTQRELV